MDVTTLLIAVYCTIDEGLSGRRLRQRGPKPTLSDSEVLTIECVGEFLGIDTDKGIYEHFRRHYRDWFPALSRVHRTTFTRQAANLWAVKAQLRQRVLDQVRFDPAVSILDSFPMPVCRFGRADRCRRLAELAAFGRDEGAKQTFYGLRAHLRVCWPGVITDGLLAPANLHDLVMAEELLVGARGLALGDRAYWSPVRAERLREQGVWLLAPPSRSAKGQLPSLPRWVTPTRRRIETVIGQLVERYHAKRVWARDPWHLWSRWQRKLLSHTLAVHLCQQHGLGSLRFADLVTTCNPHTGLARGDPFPQAGDRRLPVGVATGRASRNPRSWISGPCAAPRGRSYSW